MIDYFTLQDFETSLKEIAKDKEIVNLGLLDSEYCYLLKIDDKLGIYIRSSIGLDGACKNVGQDSIRLFLVEYSLFPVFREKIACKFTILGKSINHWITRVKGWQNRLEKAINQLIEWNQLASYCEYCNAPLHFFKVKKDGANHGRVFAICKNDKHHLPDTKPFIWITNQGSKH